MAIRYTTFLNLRLVVMHVGDSDYMYFSYTIQMFTRARKAMYTNMRQQVLSVLYLAALLFATTTTGQDIQLEKSVYMVSEGVASRHLALLVCVEGTNLEDQTYSVQIKTEDLLDSCAATDGLDYIGVEEELTLTGPGEDTQCTCVEILEDSSDEKDELFGVRISGSPFITVDSANATIRDNDGISFVFRGDTPKVDSNVVMFDLQFEGGVSSATCGVTTQASVDCSNGLAQFTLPPNRVRQFQPVITTNGFQEQTESNADPNRAFRIESHGRCSAHLINEGIVYNELTGDTTFEWVWTGPGEEGRFYCVLDSVPVGRCFSPHVVPGLTDGPHTLIVRVRGGDCAARFGRQVNFNIPPN